MVQVSLLLPPLMYLYCNLIQKSIKHVRIMFASITVTMWALVYTVTYKLNVGALPITILPTNSGDDPNKLFYIDL